MIKVNKTTFNSNILVAEAKLILIEVSENITQIGLCLSNMKLYKPVLVSESEKIEVGDWNYNTETLKLSQFNLGYKNPNYKNYKKILALPEHFPPEILKDIINGTLKDGDKVLVECETKTDEIGTMTSGDKAYNSYPIIKLNSQGHITIHKPEPRLYTEDEVLDIMAAYAVCPSDYTVTETKGDFPHQFRDKREYAAKWLKIYAK